MSGGHTIVGVVLVDGCGRVLMQLRDDRPDIADPATWVVPGGHLDIVSRVHLTRPTGR